MAVKLFLDCCNIDTRSRLCNNLSNKIFVVQTVHNRYQKEQKKGKVFPLTARKWKAVSSSVVVLLYKSPPSTPPPFSPPPSWPHGLSKTPYDSSAKKTNTLKKSRRTKKSSFVQTKNGNHFFGTSLLIIFFWMCPWPH